MPTDKSLLDQLAEQRTKLRADDTAAIEAREAERTAFEARTDRTDADLQAFLDAEAAYSEARKARKAEIRALTARIKEQRTLDARREAAAKAARSGGSIDGVTAEPLTYRADNARDTSYFRDLVLRLKPELANHFPHSNVEESRARMERHAAEMRAEMPKIEAKRRKAAEKQIEQRVERSILSALDNPFRSANDSPYGVEQRVTPNRTDGYGGYFVPPMWMDSFIKGLRPSRVTVNRFSNFDMPSGTDVIVVPKLANLTQVGVQGADNAAIVSNDWSDTAVVAPVKTIAGFSDIPVQLLDQSPYPIDKMILADLLADYDKQADLQAIQGTGAVTNSVTPTVGGQVAGLYSGAGASAWAGYNPVTYTTGSPAPSHFFSIAGAMASKIANSRYLFDDSYTIVVNPRRAWWFLSGLDTTGRPLVESTGFGPFNVQAVEPGSVPAQGLVAQLPWGHRMYASPNVPTSDTAGGGTGQDVALGFLGSDAWWFESQLQTDVFNELLSGTLQIRFRAFGYVASLLRYGQSLAIASGSGFAAPTGAVSSITF